MVGRLFKIFHKEYRGIDEAAILLGIATLASQVLGLVRDRTFAHIFGTSSTLDVYNAAFRIPDILFALAGTFISFTILIPFFIERLGQNDGNAKAREFMNTMFTVFMASMVFLTLVLFIILPWLSSVAAPGFVGPEHDLLVRMSRIMLVSPFFLGLSNLLGTVTQTFKKFFVYSLSPILYNMGIILGAVVLYPVMGPSGLAWGVVLGAIGHVAIQLPVIIREGFVPRFRFGSADKAIVFKVVRISIPRTIAMAFSKIVLLILVGMATLMPEGSVSIFTYALVLQSVPLTLIGVSYSTAAFPVLVDFFSKANMREFLQYLLRPLRQIIFWSLPMTVLFIVLRAQIVRVILGTGRFTWDDTRLVAACLALFVVSVLAQCLMLLLVRGYYAAGRTTRPLVINFISSILTIGLAFGLVALFKNIPVVQYFFESLLRIGVVPGTEVIMLPLAYSIGSWANYAVMWWFFRRDLVREHATDGVGTTFRQSFLGAVTMGFVAYQMLNIFDNVFNLDTFGGILMQGLLSGIIGIAAGVALLLAIKNREMIALVHLFKKRFWKSKNLPPVQEMMQ